MKGKYDIIMMIAVDFGPHFWTYPLCFVRLFAHPICFLLQELAVISVENRSHFFWLEMIEIWTRTAKVSVGT